VGKISVPDLIDEPLIFELMLNFLNR
jgi:hypothetical protein